MSYLHKNNKILPFYIIASVLLTFMQTMVFGMNVHAADRVQPLGDQVVIVIDPGHGGDNEGTLSGHTKEKEMTMITARAMYDELLKYDNVVPYLTHMDDINMSLADRAAIAAGVGADFLFSIHYNASENHSMFGSEVWVSCETPYNAYGYQFGYLHLQSMQDRGLFIRGVKNRIDNGKDYYGIIRESAALSVPAVIIEHCYVDEERDADYIRNEEDYAEFGRADALSAAKYFGLKSSQLGVDYSSEAQKLQPASADSLVKSTLRDSTAPDICDIELIECDYDTGEVSITVRAADYDSPLIYYDYSIDRGQTWTKLESWPGSNTLTGDYTDTFQINLNIPGGVRPSVIVRAYNMFDLPRQSNVIAFEQTFNKHDDRVGEGNDPEKDAQNDEPAAATTPADHTRNSIGTRTFMPVDGAAAKDSKEGVEILTFLRFCLALVIVLFFIVLTTQIVNYQRRKKRRHRR